MSIVERESHYKMDKDTERRGEIDFGSNSSIIMIFANSLALAATVLTAVSSVSAHGYVQEITLGSTKIAGYNPYVDP
jgi:hypothetical protein